MHVFAGSRHEIESVSSCVCVYCYFFFFYWLIGFFWLCSNLVWFCCEFSFHFCYCTIIYIEGDAKFSSLFSSNAVHKWKANLGIIWVNVSSYKYSLDVSWLKSRPYAGVSLWLIILHGSSSLDISAPRLSIHDYQDRWFLQILIRILFSLNVWLVSFLK